MRTLSLSSALFFMTIAGCTMTVDYWGRPGGFTQAQFSGDELECVAVANRLERITSADRENQNWKSCMKSKGWVIQRSETRPRPLL